MELREGIIVKSQKYQENSKIVTILNELGLDTFLIRAAMKHKSKNFAYSNELTKIAYDAVTNHNSFNILKSGKIINNFSSIKSDFHKLNDVIIILEITNNLGKHIEEYKLFYDFLIDILEMIEINDYNQYYLIIFRLKILYLLGLAPVFSKCVNCGDKTDLVGFDFLSGGMKCDNCKQTSEILYREDVIKVLKYLYLTKLEKIDKNVLISLDPLVDDSKKFLDRYYEHFLGYKSNAEKIINKMKDM